MGLIPGESGREVPGRGNGEGGAGGTASVAVARVGTRHITNHLERRRAYVVADVQRDVVA
jgi:hypothetical protein